VKITHALENGWIHHSGHLLVELGHLSGIDILCHIAALEKALDTTHLLDDGRKLGVLLDELLNFPIRHSGSASYSTKTARLLGEQFSSVLMIQFCFNKSNQALKKIELDIIFNLRLKSQFQR